ARPGHGATAAGGARRGRCAGGIPAGHRARAVLLPGLRGLVLRRALAAVGRVRRRLVARLDPRPVPQRARPDAGGLTAPGSTPYGAVGAWRRLTCQALGVGWSGRAMPVKIPSGSNRVLATRSRVALWP